MNKDVVVLTNDNWRKEVMEADGPVLVDFWAEWCAPCRMIAPSIEALATAYSGRAKVGKLNVDENPAVAQTFGVRSIPTLLVLKGGKVVDQQIGAVEDLDEAGVGHGRRERREVADGERVHQDRLAPVRRDLDEADLLEMVVEAVRLRVEGDGAAALHRAGEPGQGLGGADPGCGHGPEYTLVLGRGRKWRPCSDLPPGCSWV